MTGVTRSPRRDAQIGRLYHDIGNGHDFGYGIGRVNGITDGIGNGHDFGYDIGRVNGIADGNGNGHV